MKVINEHQYRRIEKTGIIRQQCWLKLFIFHFDRSNNKWMYSFRNETHNRLIGRSIWLIISTYRRYVEHTHTDRFWWSIDIAICRMKIKNPFKWRYWWTKLVVIFSYHFGIHQIHVPYIINQWLDLYFVVKGLSKTNLTIELYKLMIVIFHITLSYPIV